MKTTEELNTELIDLQEKYSKMFDEFDIKTFPPFWFEIDNDKLKIEVLKRAIEQKDYIVNVKGGSAFVEEIIFEDTKK